MSIDSAGGAGALGVALERILAGHRSEIAARSITLRLDLDPEWSPQIDAEFEDALRALFRLILATVPDGCAVDLEATRSAARVASVGAGQWSARWQVAGDDGARRPGEPTQLHPRSGHATDHLRSSLANRTRAAFARTDWRFSLDAVDQVDELLARATRP